MTAKKKREEKRGVMACCLYCFKGDPIEGDEKADRSNKFQIPLENGCYQYQPW